MTKPEEQKILYRLNSLEKEVADLHAKLEDTKIDKHVYTVAETASILGVTRQAVYAMIDRGELEFIKLGHIKIKGDSLRTKLGA